MASNKTAFLDGKGTPLRIADSPMPVPGPNEITVKNDFLAVNPIDHKMQDFGFLIKQYPYVLGSDVAGTVHSVGTEVKKFKVGDRVVGHAWGFLTQKTQDGAFSLYSNLPVANTAAIPANVKTEEAVVLPLAIDTATNGLCKILGIPFASIKPESTGQVIVVYGASSSIGAAATQLASNAGVRVVAVASTRNHGLVRSCGAGDVFDHNDADVVSSIVSAVKKGSEAFVGIFDAISKDSSYAHDRDVFEQLGGGKLAYSTGDKPAMSENVTATHMFGIGDFACPHWQEFVTPGLERGLLKGLPKPVILGSGLEVLQSAMERLKAGVSAQKLVVKL